MAVYPELLFQQVRSLSQRENRESVIQCYAFQFSKSKSKSIKNSLSLRWDISKSFFVNGQFDLNLSDWKSDKYTSPENSAYENYTSPEELAQKGNTGKALPTGIRTRENWLQTILSLWMSMVACSVFMPGQRFQGEDYE